MVIFATFWRFKAAIWTEVYHNLDLSNLFWKVLTDLEVGSVLICVLLAVKINLWSISLNNFPEKTNLNIQMNCWYWSYSIISVELNIVHFDHPNVNNNVLWNETIFPNIHEEHLKLNAFENKRKNQSRLFVWRLQNLDFVCSLARVQSRIDCKHI